MAKKVIKKRYQGKPKIINTSEVKRTYTEKNWYKQPDSDIKCKSCNNGLLKRLQWNRLLCTNHKCHYSELI